MKQDCLLKRHWEYGECRKEERRGLVQDGGLDEDMKTSKKLAENQEPGKLSCEDLPQKDITQWIKLTQSSVM